MDIHWGNLGTVFGVSLGITLLTVVLFSLGVAAWPGDDDAERAFGVGRPVAVLAALLCFATCLAVAAYGLALIIGS